jgi:hypothetical protein
LTLSFIYLEALHNLKINGYASCVTSLFQAKHLIRPISLAENLSDSDTQKDKRFSIWHSSCQFESRIYM